MRVVMNGNTQLLHTLMLVTDPRWPHVNVHRCQLFFPDTLLEAGNSGASVKIGGSGLTTDMTDVWDVLTGDGRKFIPTQGGLMNGVSLKSIYVRGSAASTVLIVEPIIG